MPLAEIHPYRAGDQLEVEAFFYEVWQRSRFPFDPDGSHSDLRRIPTFYLSDGGGFWLMRQPEIIGTVALRRLSGDVGELKRLNVGDRHRRSGLGSQLIRHAILPRLH